MKLILTFLIFSCIFHDGLAQNQFNNDIDYLFFTIKDTYAGYQDKVKGNQFDALLKQVKKSNSLDTFALLSRATTFFKDNHVMLLDLGIEKKKIDTQQCKKDSQRIHQYLAAKKRRGKYEGYWLSESNNCVIALKKVRDNPATYYGYLVETKASLLPGYCMLKMIRQKDGTYLTDYIDEDYYFRAFLRARFKNLNTLWLNSYDKFRSISKYTPGLLTNKQALSYKPTFTNIDGETVVITMPSFKSSYAKSIDSLIKANKQIIDRANTLILDIRNNSGGFINCYLPLLPYIYTSPILHTGGYSLIGNQFIKQYDDRIKRFTANGDTASANNYIKNRDRFLQKKGQFEYNPPATLAKDLPILAKPKNVAILINNNCLSAAELMLLNFKQSKKVTIFGERTGGAVDYLNAMSFTLPYSGYELSIASVKRLLKPHEPSYDATGIFPDVEIEDEVIDWVAFVKKYYDEHK